MQSVSIQIQKTNGMGLSIFMDKIMVILQVNKKLSSTKSVFVELWFMHVTNVIYMHNEMEDKTSQRCCAQAIIGNIHHRQSQTIYIIGNHRRYTSQAIIGDIHHRQSEAIYIIGNHRQSTYPDNSQCACISRPFL